ncbi:MAG: parallel beta-helix domain-containing protein [Chitinophagales bacterium]
MNHFRIILFSAILFLLYSCSEQKEDIQWKSIEKSLNTKFIKANDGDTIDIPEGHYKFKGTIWLEGKNDITVRGAGMDKTFLSFKGQEEGSEGLKITNGRNITVLDITLQDSKGDLIKAQKIDGLTFKNVKTEWLGEPNEENGAYGFYPVDCDRVLLDNSIAIGASDAGIYVGQSRDVIVRNCTAYHNVAGIEIENCVRADVYDCLAHENTGGILIFDMPDLTQNGREVRVFNNKVISNNYRNFAPEGNIVGEVPPGTGIMVLATTAVEIFDNEIDRNKTIGIAIASYKLVQKPYDDPDFNPYPKSISIYNNTISKGLFQFPTFDNDLGKLLLFKFPFSRPDILFDGFFDPEIEQKDGNYVAPYQICVGENNGAKFANIDAANDFANIITELDQFNCEPTNFPAVRL